VCPAGTFYFRTDYVQCFKFEWVYVFGTVLKAYPSCKEALCIWALTLHVLDLRVLQARMESVASSYAALNLIFNAFSRACPRRTQVAERFAASEVLLASIQIGLSRWLTFIQGGLSRSSPQAGTAFVYHSPFVP
jgi:hypothetical protein